MKKEKFVRLTWLVEDFFGDSFVRIWEGELIASPTLEGAFVEGELDILTSIGIRHTDKGDWGWVDLPASVVTKMKVDQMQQGVKAVC